jgi:hypothetical protein
MELEVFELVEMEGNEVKGVIKSFKLLERRTGKND